MRPKLLLVTIMLALLSWHFTDMKSEAVFAGVVMPLLLLLSLVMFALWFLTVMYERRVTTADDTDMDPAAMGLTGDADKDSELLGLGGDTDNSTEANNSRD